MFFWKKIKALSRELSELKKSTRAELEEMRREFKSKMEDFADHEIQNLEALNNLARVVVGQGVFYYRATGPKKDGQGNLEEKIAELDKRSRLLAADQSRLERECILEKYAPIDFSGKGLVRNPREAIIAICCLLRKLEQGLNYEDKPRPKDYESIRVYTLSPDPIGPDCGVE